MYSITTDLSRLTTIPKDALDKLCKKALWVIADNFSENIGGVAEIDIAIGRLIIEDGDESIRYKFIPSPDLEDMIHKVSLDRTSPLHQQMEARLVNKIVRTYKDVL